MFRNLIPMLADEYHVVTPYFPGYGESSTPPVDDFDYSFERLATVTRSGAEEMVASVTGGEAGAGMDAKRWPCRFGANAHNACSEH